MTGGADGGEGVAIDRGLPDTERAVALLQSAYGDWGDAALFEWKYADYPGFDPERCFSITAEGDLVAFRRLFDRSIRGRREYDCFVLGDTCVAPDHRGRGLYSALHAATTEATREAGRAFSATFNRRGALTFDANRDRGWRFRSLPLRLRVLSPSAVLPEYADMALADDALLTRALRRVGRRVALRFADGRLRADALVDDSAAAPGHSGWAIPVPVPQRLLEAAVEAVVGDPRTAVRRRIGRPPSGATDVETTVRDAVDEATLSAFLALYERVLPAYDLHFRRERADVRHLLSHPGLVGTVTARRDGDLVGFAPVALKATGRVTEAHVLDLVAVDADATAALSAAVTDLAREAGADAVVAVTDRELGPRWIGVDRQVFMWDDAGPDTGLLDDGSLFVGLYDVEMG